MRRIILMVTAMIAALALTACGGSDDVSEPMDGSVAPAKIEVTVEGDTISPIGERVMVKVGQPVQFVVTSDAPGELHMHTDPEKTLAYSKGTTILEAGSFDRSGVFEVESHELHKTIVQLQVQ